MSMIGHLFALPSDLIEHLKTDEAVREEWLGDTGELDTHCLDKKWQAVHFVLTGSVEPTSDLLSAAVFGREPLFEDDGAWAYGPPQYVTAEDVQAIALRLKATVGSTAVKARSLAQELAAHAVYPNVWTRDHSASQEVTELAEYLEDLTDYYAGAAKAKLAMIMWVE